MIEGSVSGSGSGSIPLISGQEAKNILIRRIRIRNTAHNISIFCLPYSLCLTKETIFEEKTCYAELANCLPQHTDVPDPDIDIITQYLYFYTILACMGR
jgi:hypothetical protein